MEFIVCSGTWVRNQSANIDCDGELTTMTLEEVRNIPFAQMTGEQKAQLTSSLITFFVLIFVLVKLRRLA
ncbi:hypothetical protein BBI09_17355 [Stutzerimonas xanthomarina]|uniref:hypothetical protein n=1 Tax=Stutzerimonas nitrititolerans TaxID=2482751 RepID=UPI000826FE0E|nr:hypothetical protein [Stutzerimonas nitrititolerans]OCX15510.1 hypothetical protein BBI09_17305 [Stutzerimonas xanthomarina]OCX15519.1 hypothetical protein BBI09_17355 [Stutzerimonas xanthomarina]